jgi:hypothetical protein
VLAALLLCGCGARETGAPAAAGPSSAAEGLQTAESSSQVPAEELPAGVRVAEDAPVETGETADWGQRQYRGVYTAASGEPCLERTLTVPCTRRTGPVRDAADRFFQAELCSQRERCTAWIGEYLTPEAADGAAEPWFVQSSWTPLWENARLLAFSGSEEGYLGGAHGWHTNRYLLLDAASGALLAPEDLFTDGAALLRREILEQVRQSAGATEERARQAGACLERPDFLRSQLFADAQGVGVCFNEYDIDCYAAGSFVFVVPYARLSGVLSPERFGDILRQ